MDAINGGGCMKEIDESIKAALRDAAVEFGSVLKLSREFGVSHSTVLFWNSGRTKRIDGDVWRDKVYPVIAPYLKSRNGGRLSAKERPGRWREMALGVAPMLHEVPVIGLAQAAGFDPVIEPFEAYARGCGSGTALFTTAPKPGYFALKVEGASMEPEFPEGTLILVAGGEFVQDGDIVVARIRESGQVVIKRHQHGGEGAFRLESLNPGGACFEWERGRDRGFLEWMHPVVEAKVDLRARRLSAISF
jgi:SOS-response transcriptional repressor LexA